MNLRRCLLLLSIGSVVGWSACTPTKDQRSQAPDLGVTEPALIGAGRYPYSMALTPSGRFAYVVNYSSDTISAYSVADDGVLRRIGTDIPTGPVPFGIAVDSSERFVYVSNSNESDTSLPGSISIYSLNGSTGALTRVGPDVPTGTRWPRMMAVHTTDRYQYLYVGNAVSNDISAYRIEPTGVLTAVAGAPFGASGEDPFGIATYRSGESSFAYVANHASNTISAFRINQDDGRLALIENAPSGSGPLGIALHPTARFLYSANWYSRSVSLYTIDQVTGALARNGPDVLTGSNPIGATVDPSGRYLYVTNSGSDSISGYNIDETTGTLSPLNLSPFVCGSTPVAFAIHPTGRFAYATNRSGVWEYDIYPGGTLFRSYFATLRGALDIVPNPGPPEASWDDLNGMEKNPYWGDQVVSGLCPNPRAQCPGVVDVSEWTSRSRGCTRDTITTTNSFLCVAGGYDGHVNWRAVAYEGKLTWDSKSSEIADDDYNIYIKSETWNGLCTTANRDKVLLEFDSDETIDHFDSQPWWRNFHTDVDTLSRNPGSINDKDAFVIGLVTLDCAHSCHSELHPVYVLAIHDRDAISDDRWVFFARNWGDEGFCSSGDWPLPRGTLKLLFKRPDAVDMSIRSTNIIRSGSETWSTELVRGRGAVMTINLPEPSRHGWVAGEVHLDWVVPTAPWLRVTIEGYGSIVSNPPGIDCGPTCASQFRPNTSVHLTPQLASGWQFVGFYGACTGGGCDVVMDGDKSVGAVFRPCQLDCTGLCGYQMDSCGEYHDCGDCGCRPPDCSHLCGLQPDSCGYLRDCGPCGTPCGCVCCLGSECITC